MSDIEKLLNLVRAVQAYLHIKVVQLRMVPIDHKNFNYQIYYSTYSAPTTYESLYNGDNIRDAIEKMEEFIKKTPNDFNQVVIKLKKLEAECNQLRLLLETSGYVDK